MSEIQIHTDGAARGNPGPAAIAFTISGSSSEIIEFGQTIGETTNNQAEYRAMRAAVQKLLELQPSGSNLNFYSDSELMVKQLRGEYRVKDANIRPIYDEIQTVLNALKAQGNLVELHAVRREKNKRADELANLALDGKI